MHRKSSQNGHHDAAPVLLYATMNWPTEIDIIRAVTPTRIKLAESRRKALSIARIAGRNMPMIEKELPAIFPPRRQWEKFRPRKPGGKSEDQLRTESLIRCMFTGLRENRGERWADELRLFIYNLQNRITGSNQLELDPPRVYPVVDRSRNPPKVRYISQYCFRDSVLLALANRSLTKQIDCYLESGCVAFRHDRQRNAHEAIREIHAFREATGDLPIFVAECDIKSFFDVLSHAAVRTAFDRFAALLADSGSPLNPAISRVLDAFLRSYSFPENVIGKFPEAIDKWPEDELVNHYTSPRLERLGIPQGGALSGVISNMVLASVDASICGQANSGGKKLAYWRYCDDSMILARDKGMARKAINCYCQALDELRLPYYPPIEPSPYVGIGKKEFWAGKTKSKSKSPYLWASPSVGGFPWIQFLGFQIRWDGFMRPRPEFERKQHRKMRKTFHAIKKALLVRFASAETPAPKITRAFVIRSLAARVMAAAFGRSETHSRTNSSKSWSTWASLMREFPYASRFLRAFDRSLGACLNKIQKVCSPLPPGDGPSNQERSTWNFFKNFRRGGRSSNSRGRTSNRDIY
jgi:hypothetical protein